MILGGFSLGTNSWKGRKISWGHMELVKHGADLGGLVMTLKCDVAGVNFKNNSKTYIYILYIYTNIKMLCSMLPVATPHAHHSSIPFFPAALNI